LLAKAEVKEWKLNRIGDQGLATQSAVKKLKERINSDCKNLSPADEVEVISQTITDEQIYNDRYQTKLQSSDLVLVRRSQNNSYIIKATIGWDYDLPLPQSDVQLEQTSNCQYKHL
jgi:hypothetical protein